MANKTIQASFVQHNATVTAQDLNRYDIMHGGRLMTLCDEIGYLAAKKHAEEECLTRAAHQIQFLSMLKEGDRFIVEARVILCGSSTLWTECSVKKDGGKGGDKGRQSVMSSWFVYIAVDKQMKPRPVAPVHAESDSEKALQSSIKSFRDQVLKG